MYVYGHQRNHQTWPSYGQQTCGKLSCMPWVAPLNTPCCARASVWSACRRVHARPGAALAGAWTAWCACARRGGGCGAHSTGATPALQRIVGSHITQPSQRWAVAVAAPAQDEVLLIKHLPCGCLCFCVGRGGAVTEGVSNHLVVSCSSHLLVKESHKLLYGPTAPTHVTCAVLCCGVLCGVLR